MELFELTAWKDLMLDENLDLVIQDGDFVILDAQNQAAKVLSIAEKGCFKQHPNIGIGTHQYTNAPMTAANQAVIKTDLRKQLEQDGHRNFNITLEQNDDNIKITITT